MLTTTIEQLAARLAAWNARRAADVFMTGRPKITPEMKKIADAVNQYGNGYQTAIINILGATIVDEAELRQAMVASTRGGGPGQLRDPRPGDFVTPSSNPNSHDYGRQPTVYLGGGILDTGLVRAGLSSNGRIGNNLPSHAEGALRPTTAAEIRTWLVAYLGVLADRPVAAADTLGAVLDAWVARVSSADAVDQTRIDEVRNSVRSMGCQTDATRALVTALGHPEMARAPSPARPATSLVGCVASTGGSGRGIVIGLSSSYPILLSSAGRITLKTHSDFREARTSDPVVVRATITAFLSALFAATEAPAAPRAKKATKPKAAIKEVAPKAAPKAAATKSSAKSSGKKTAGKAAKAKTAKKKSTKRPPVAVG